MATIRVRIDRLVLDGWTGDRHAAEQVRAAVTAELTRLFSESDGFESGGAIPRVDGGSVTWGGGDVTELGSSIGQAVYGSMTP